MFLHMKNSQHQLNASKRFVADCTTFTSEETFNHHREHFLASHTHTHTHTHNTHTHNTHTHNIHTHTRRHTHTCTTRPTNSRSNGALAGSQTHTLTHSHSLNLIRTRISSRTRKNSTPAARGRQANVTTYTRTNIHTRTHAQYHTFTPLYIKPHWLENDSAARSNDAHGRHKRKLQHTHTHTHTHSLTHKHFSSREV